jgi:hypothetical protein
LFKFKAAVRIVTIAALHGAFENFVVERGTKRWFHLAVTTQAELGLAVFQQLHRRKSRLFCIRSGNVNVGAGQVFSGDTFMRRMAFGTTDVIAPVLTAAEVVVFFFAGMAGKTSLRNFFGRLVFEGDDLCWISFFGVRFTWPVTGFAASHLLFPGTYCCQLGV